MSEKRKTSKVKRRHGIANHPAHILTVDDEQYNRTLLEVMLQQEGYAVTTAASGEEAMEAIALHDTDLVLLDIMMPGMDGYEVAGRIKRNPATKNIPIIVITVLDDRKARLLGLGAGAEDFLTKPVDPAELRVRVRNLLRLKEYGDFYDSYSRALEDEAGSHSADMKNERDRAQQYLDTAAVILLALDNEGRITLVNRYACSVLGWTENELRGCEFIEMCVPERLREETREKFRRLLAGPEASVAENAIITKLGEERLIEWHNTVLRDDEGRGASTFSSGIDVTERNQATEALRAAEERMRFALESADVGIWDKDYTTGVVQWSGILESQYGLEPGAFAGTSEAFLEGVHPEDRESLRSTFENAAALGTDFSEIHRSVGPDGKVRWLSGAGRIYLGEDGAPLRGVGISMDITERRALEGQYQQAQKMEAIGRLASGVAHDFNNLLTVILGFADLVATDTVMASHHGADIGEITKAATRAIGLTSQLLAFSRQQVLHTAPIGVNDLITKTTGMLQRLIGENIQVTLELEPGPCAALGDRSQLEQVVMNLVVNARDAMPEGGKLVIGTTTMDLEDSSLDEETIMDGRYVMISITDSGVGMTKETQRHVFEPFFTTKEVGKGTERPSRYTCRARRKRSFRTIALRR